MTSPCWPGPTYQACVATIAGSYASSPANPWRSTPGVRTWAPSTMRPRPDLGSRASPRFIAATGEGSGIVAHVDVAERRAEALDHLPARGAGRDPSRSPPRSLRSAGRPAPAGSGASRSASERGASRRMLWTTMTTERSGGRYPVGPIRGARLAPGRASAALTRWPSDGLLLPPARPLQRRPVPAGAVTPWRAR